jgi:hypothetical protein
MSSRSDRHADETYFDEEGRADVDEYGFEHDEWETGEDESIWRFWDEGIITLLIVGGAILFLFPEPITSGVGVLMMGAGLLFWLVDWLT